MRTDEKGNIVSATRAEIVRHYYAGDLKDLFTLEEYIALLRYQGTVILNDNAENPHQD